MLAQSQPISSTTLRCRTAAGVPFESTEQAWFWTMAALFARREGIVSVGYRVTRPCDPEDIVKCLDSLYRRRRINLEHARVLRTFGERGSAPAPRGAIFRLWREALSRLDFPLRIKGIVA